MRVADARFTPCCAGILVVHRSGVLLTLGSEDRWENIETGGVRIPVSGIGGGQNPGETMLECATREAFEETGQRPVLIHSPVTYVETAQGAVAEASFADVPAPFLYQIQRRVTEEPYGPDLPSGWWLHVAIYRATLPGEPKPVDVPGLIYVPWSALGLLVNGLRLSEAPRFGLQLQLRPKTDLPLDVVLWIPEVSTERLLLDVVRRFHIEGTLQ